MTGEGEDRGVSRDHAPTTCRGDDSSLRSDATEGPTSRCPRCDDPFIWRAGQWVCTCDYEAWLAGFEQ